MMKKSTLSSLYFLISCNVALIVLELVVLSIASSNFVSDIKLPWSGILSDIVLTIFTHLASYAILTIWEWATFIAIKNYWWKKTNKTDGLLLFIWLVFTGVLFFTNLYYFPQSKYAILLSAILPSVLSLGMLVILYVLLLTLVGLSLLAWLKAHKVSFFSFVAILSLALGLNLIPQSTKLPSQSKQPNIFLIGIDSLNLHEINPVATPTIYHFIKRSTIFSKAVTPLARTYPSWTSILTGLYPKHSGAIFNLMPAHTVNTSASIAWQLKKHGYMTVFATDDRRFSTIDKDFGFDKVIGPKLGVNDLIIGSINDFPISNLLINTRLGKWLYPYNYINRASFYSYYPNTFSHEVNQQLQHIHDSPLFFAIHYTLPHWPYSWAETSPQQAGDQFKLADKEAIYKKAIVRADKQVAKLLSLLKKQHRLDNAIIILLSDHGEVLYEKGSRITKASNYQGQGPSRLATYLKQYTDTTLEESGGHGSDLLSPGQFFTLLSFHVTKNNQLINEIKNVSTNVSLLDIKPTLLNFLSLKDQGNLDGVSLMDTITKNIQPPQNRYFYMESGMFPNLSLSKRGLVKIAQEYFTVNPNNSHVELQKEKIKELKAQKLYAVLWKQWLLAIYPEKKHYIPIFVNLENKKWDDNLDSTYALKTPAKQLYQKLIHFFFL